MSTWSRSWEFATQFWPLDAGKPLDEIARKALAYVEASADIARLTK